MVRRRTITETRRVPDRVEEIFALAPGRSGGATRPAFSREEADAMQPVAGWAREIYLEPAVDPHGNLWCLPPGEEPVVTSGSHVDIVPRGGAPAGVRPLPRSPPAARPTARGRGGHCRSRHGLQPRKLFLRVSAAGDELGLHPPEVLPAEALSACTANAAYVLGLDVGRLAPGYRADALLLDVPDWRHLAYHLGGDRFAAKIKSGRLLN